MPVILGFSGKAKAGKDTAADYLVKNHGFVRISFADRLKVMVNDLYGVPAEVGHSTLKDTYQLPSGRVVREAYQKFGELARVYDVDVWFTHWFHAAQELGTRIVCADARYPNEFVKLRQVGAVVVRVYREGSGLTGSVGTHSSETDQDNVPDAWFDAILTNNSSFESYYAQIDNILKPLLGHASGESSDRRVGLAP
jgi:hypothetical protein